MQEAAKALKRTAGSRSACEGGGLDRAFAGLDRALDPARSAVCPRSSPSLAAALRLNMVRIPKRRRCAACSSAEGRITLLERLVASMQAARLLLVSRRGAPPEDLQPQPTDAAAERTTCNGSVSVVPKGILA